MPPSEFRFFQCFLLFISGLFMTSRAFAQDQEIWYSSISIPPSPNAASIAKYADIPVDKSTGIPGISIPVVTIQDAGVALPISLNYHAGGIQVQENASWVGLGWVINCGGVISRQMRGLPDEMTNGYLEVADRVPSSLVIENELATPSIREDTYFMLEELTTAMKDYEPDQFSYSFGGYNGSFHISNNKEPITLQSEMLNIEPIFDADDIIGFRVVDPDGTIYYFGNYEGKDCTEHTNVDVRGVDPPDYISSWYLNKIINPRTNAVIELFYDTHYYTQSVNYSQTRSYEAVGAYYYPAGGLQLNPCTTIIPNAKYLSKIKFDNGEVQFWHSEAYGSNRKLDSIKWTNYAISRVFSFEYSYFQFNRLKLNSFKERSAASEIKYSFEYYTPDLPVQTSYSQDYWGYFNGKSNLSMVPQLEYGTQILGDADRSPSLTHTLACSLKKIYYPTGGYVMFDYELNSYSRSVTIDDIGVYESESVSVTGSGPHSQVCENSEPVPFNSGLMSYMTDIQSSNIDLLNKNTGGMSVTYLPLLTDQYNYSDVNVNAEVSISDLSSYSPSYHYGRVYLVDNTIQSTTLLAQVAYNNPIGLDLNNLDFSHSYSLQVCANGSITTTWAEISYKKYDPDDLQGTIDVPSGGLRVNKISSFEPGTGQYMYKTFDYAGSGYTTSYHPGPVHYYTVTKRINHLISGYEIINGIMLYSSPPSGSIGRIAYNKVIEDYGTLAENTGKTETLFYPTSDLGHSGIPYPPIISNAWLRSKVISERIFEYNPSTQAYRKVQQKDYDYDFNPQHHREIRGFKATRVQTHTAAGGFLTKDYPNDFYFENYSIFSNCYQLINETITELQINGDSIVISKDYYYDNPRHLLPTRIQYYDSKGDLVQITNKYSLDFVTCNNNCLQDYYDAVALCKSTLTETYQELSLVRQLYGSCYSTYLEEYGLMMEDIEANCTHRTINIFGNLVNWRSLKLDCIADAQTFWHIDENMRTCLTTSGYYASLGSYSRPYLQCIIEANIDLNECKVAFLNCLATEYSNSTGTLQGALFMATHNIVNPIIERITNINNVEKEHVYWNYEIRDSFRLVLSSIDRMTNGTLFTETVFNNHDQKGNPVEVTDRGIGLKTSYIWGYNHTLPIVEASNARYDQIYFEGFEDNHMADSTSGAHTGRKCVTSSFTIPSLSLNTQKPLLLSYWYFEGGIWKFSGELTFVQNYTITKSRIDDIRVFPAGSFVTTYTYSPGIGTTSETDPNGITTNYEYDSFGRLKNVRDNDGKITSRNYYHYYNDPSSDTPYLNTSPTSLSFQSSASDSSLGITSNTTWSITDDATWLSVNTSSGTGNATIIVSVTANTSTARNATITITYAGGLTKTVSVSQAAGTSTLTVSPQTINFGSIAPPQTVTVTSNTSWTVTKSASWIILSTNSGTGNGTVGISATKLTSGTRTGTVTFKTTDNTVTRVVQIYQNSGM